MIPKLSNIMNNHLSSGCSALTLGLKEYEQCQLCFQTLMRLDTVSACVFLLPKSILLSFLKGFLDADDTFQGRSQGLSEDGEVGVGIYIAHGTPTS